METNKIHLVCSSGGVKCLSYIGAIQKLYTSGLSIASVSACSMGTVIGAMVCAGMDLKEIENKVLQYDFSKLRSRNPLAFFKVFRYPFAAQKTPNYEKIMNDLIGKDITLGEMKIPFSAAALDLRQKRFLVYSSETHPNLKVSEIVKIATAIPLLYKPHKLDKRILVDAAVASKSPIWMAANNPGRYPIVVLKPIVPYDTVNQGGIGNFIGNIVDASAESHDAFTLSQTSRAIEIAINTKDMHYANFGIGKDEIEELILQGQSAAEQKLREFKNNFYQILDEEEVQGPISTNNPEDKAEFLADQMITGYQNEVLKRNQVFVSYSHDDKDWMLRLKTYLKSIERFTGIKTWDDSRIKPGEEWNRAIERALISTKVAVFLVTQNFLASDFIQDREMNYFLEVSKKENVSILWIAIRSSTYEITPLKDLQSANDPNKPLAELTEAEQDEELTKISKKIIDLMGSH